MPSNNLDYIAVPAADLRCPNVKPYLTIPANQGPRATELIQCTDCGLVVEDSRPPKAEIDAFYSNKKLWTDSADVEGKPRSYVNELNAKRPLFLDLVRRMETFKKKGRLLDVGAGPGLLGSVLSDLYWEYRAIELSPYAVEFGRKQLGIEVEQGRFEAMDLPHKHFDVVMMKYVLDHTETPFAALQKARTVIADDGILCLADLINVDSIAAKIFKDGHRLFHPMHFTYFSPKTIAEWLGRAGFKVVRIDYPFLYTPYFNLSNLTTFAGRVVKKLMNFSVSKTGPRVYSTAFYGSMMDVWAVPAGASGRTCR